MKFANRILLNSIKSDAQLAAAQRVIDDLLGRAETDAGCAMYVDALSDLIAVYENQHHAIERASNADMLRHLLESNGVSQSRLARETGLPKSMISEVLAGKRPFSRGMIRKLADFFHVPAGVLAANI